ncbi:MAG: hypothetical protein VW708_00125 [Ilumatobacter sp.]
MTPRSALGVAVAVLRRPALWPTALRQLSALSPSGWWREGSRRPGPPSDYLHFRLVTQYGGSGRSIASRDVVNYLAWCRDWRRMCRSYTT